MYTLGVERMSKLIGVCIMIRFFVAPLNISDDLVRLSVEDSTHIRSLRMRANELFVICDGEGTDYICRLGQRSASLRKPQIMSVRAPNDIGRSIAEIVESRPSQGEPSVDCDVYIALAKGERLDYAVQKSVELGAHSIVLFPSDRCVSLPDDMSKKTARLQRIALETAKQCGRGRIPEVTSVASFKSAIRQAARNCLPSEADDSQPEEGECQGRPSGLSLFFYELEETLHLKEALEQHFLHNPQIAANNPQPGGGSNVEISHKMSGPTAKVTRPGSGSDVGISHKASAPTAKVTGPGSGSDVGISHKISGPISIVTGPEGGFEHHEAEFARSSGLTAVSLGPRILRCETAPVVALAAVMFHTGNL